MTPWREHHDTVHLVGVPGGSPHTAGRLSGMILLGGDTRERLGLSPGRVVLVGGGQAKADAAEFGVRGDRVVVPALGRTDPLVWPWELRRLIGSAGSVVCWTDELAGMASRMSRRVTLVSTLPQACPANPRRLARIVCLSERDEHAWRAKGTTAELLAAQSPVAPACDAARQHSRARLGVGPGVLLFAPLTDRPTETDARGAAFLLTLLHTMGYPVAALLPACASNMAVARRHHHGTGSPYPLLLTDLPIPSLLPAVDAVMTSHPPVTGSDWVLNHAAVAAGAEVLHLSHSGRAGLQGTPGAAASLVDPLDALLTKRGMPPLPRPRRPEPTHA